MKTAPLLLAVAVLAAGCVAVPVDPSGPTLSGVRLVAAGAELTVDAHQGALSRLQLGGELEAVLHLAPGVLLLDAERRLVPAAGPVPLAPGEQLTFLPPYGVEALEVRVETASASELARLPLGVLRETLVSGAFAVDELARQRDMFPHRTPGLPGYGASQAYFAAFFESLGYDVEVDPYGTMAYDSVKLPAGPTRGISPSSLANVVAMKKGTASPERYLVFGGHYDVVEATRDGAFDNTAGTAAVLAVARAFANLTTSHTVVFALWGGEEDGILGSQFWATTHPDKVARTDLYVNFDVTALAWPAPKTDPAPIVVAAGPDGPVASRLHAQAAEIEQTWMRTEAAWVHQTVAVGQATGAGVNAQSDHTPFALRGVPAAFLFSERVDDIRAFIHGPQDTLENMTRYSVAGNAGVGQELAPEEMAEGAALLARSFETQMYWGFYLAVLTDAGHFAPARAATP